MTKKNKHISEKDFQRYLADNMTDAERNAFERELQKYPFEAEALEGFQQISPEELSDDLQELKAKLFSEKRKNSYRYWAVAATLLLLVTSGILWIQLKDKNPVPAVTENKIIPKPEVKAAPEEEKITTQNQPEKETQVQILSAPKEANVEEPEIKIKPAQSKKAVSKVAETKTDKTQTVTQPKTLNIVNNFAQTQNNINKNANSKNGIADMQFQDKYETPNKFMNFGNTENPAKRSSTTNINDSIHLPESIFSGKIGNAMAVSNVGGYGTEKNFDSTQKGASGISNIEFGQSGPTSDTNKVFGTFPIHANQNEITIRGYGKPEINKEVSSALKTESNVHVSPAGGMIEYEKYLEKKAVLPDNYKRNRVVVKLLVTFDKFGSISGITNENKADSLVFEMAKKIIETGPKWSPEIRNRMPVNSEKELRIVFRKRK